MNWNSKDTELFRQQKEYVDTVIMPLVPLSFNEGMKGAASQYEFLQLLTVLLEKQFRGRILLVPPFTYLEQQTADEKITNLNQWLKEIGQAGFKHTFLLTSDSYWKTEENQIDGSLIWVPSVPLEHMEESYKYSLIEDQAKQFVNIIVQKWQENMS
ncbi:hypothetical protein JOC78_000923 [Bacillus ectoiniformans]|uniref:YpiF family protein n=1 Tax=Bacillus ectoiniformans TaxID=1494429 RepID=UPI00195C32F2|nr:YpiF family protein [Bacillus ectoiniformans]MBM7647983.1 hypothetical protein [Bacillus ectoiniformans]